MRKRKQKGTPDAQDAAALEGEQALADGGAPLLVHLQALRRVLIVSAAAVAIAFFLVYSFAIDYLMAWITGPIAARGIEIIYTAMSEALDAQSVVEIPIGRENSSTAAQNTANLRPSFLQRERLAQA